MEKLKPKHDHALTNIVKVFIFALMLLMPFLVFLPNGLYYGFNEHATNDTTTEINYKYESNEVNTFDDIQLGKVYHADYLDFTDDFSTDQLNEYVFEFYSFEEFNFDTSIDDYYTGYTMDVYDNKDNWVRLEFFNNWSYNVSFTNSNVYVEYDLSLSEVYLAIYDCDFSITNGNVSNFLIAEEGSFGYSVNNYSISNFNVIESVTENVEQTITQQMYNGWQQMWETPLFNWTSNSILNTGLTAFCTAFGISNTSYITNFLTYELVIVAIYIVLDIVLTLFTWLTHIGQKE